MALYFTKKASEQSKILQRKYFSFCICASFHIALEIIDSTQYLGMKKIDLLQSI